MAQQDNTTDDTKRIEDRLRREAKRKGYLLRRSQRHDESNGLYVLIHDSKGNRLPGAAAAPNAFLRGEGMTLQGIADELASLPDA